MLTTANIATIQSALDILATYPTSYIGCTLRSPVELKTLGISVSYYASREYNHIGARKITRKVNPAHYEAECDIESLAVWASGKTRAAALRNLFKALRNAASVNAPTLRVPLVLCEPTKAQAQARAERKAQREQEAARKMITEQRWLDAQARKAQRETAPTIIVAESLNNS